MKRRQFITTMAFSLLNIKLLMAKSIFTCGNTQCINGKTFEINSKIIRLPSNPYPFKDVIHLDINDLSTIHQLDPKGEKVMGTRKAFKTIEKKRYTLQYTGKDIGWLVL